MPCYLIYDIETGRIARRVFCREEDAQTQARPSEALLEISADLPISDAEFYITQTGEIWPRPALPPPPQRAEIGDTVRLTLPVAAQVSVGDAMKHLAAGVHDVTFETDGQYLITIAPDFPYRPLQTSIQIA